MRFLLLLVVVAGCVQQRSERCKHVCAREYECTTQVGSASPFDEKQCIAACNQLEASQAARVQQHADCVAAHAACGEVLDCRW